MDLKGDPAVLGDVEMEVPHFDFLDSVRKFNVLIALYFFSFYDEAYGNRVSEFCGDLKIKWDCERDTVFMTGPAEVVFDGEWEQ